MDKEGVVCNLVEDGFPELIWREYENRESSWSVRAVIRSGSLLCASGIQVTFVITQLGLLLIKKNAAGRGGNGAVAMGADDKVPYRPYSGNVCKFKK